MMRRGRFAGCVLIAVTLTACGGGELSRGKAASLLKDSQYFKQREYLRFHDGMQYSLSDDAEELDKLVDRGLLRKERQPKASGLFRYENVYLTESGQTASNNWKKDGADEATGKTVLLIPRGEMTAEVTGVFQRDAVEALADFKWRFEPNDYALGAAGAGTSVALFRKYDDGWRLADIEKR